SNPDNKNDSGTMVSESKLIISESTVCVLKRRFDSDCECNTFTVRDIKITTEKNTVFLYIQ
ncbi:MAG TPA: hypothetical protein PKK66_06120, partial [Bacteroidales bacterium]|nr:hypothetical protein [Bacteroidales bacterium]